MNDMKDLTLVVGVLLLTVVLLLVTPVVFIWSVNLLFGTGIQYDTKSILAAWCLLFIVRLVTRTEVKRETLPR